MIIVSQDRNRIVENLNLGIKIAGEYNKNYKICNTKIGVDLGEYATEERAKTVLQEIIELYRKDTFYKETQIDSGVYSRKEINHPLPKVYEMPEV